jgi:hypothetical protein
MALPKGHIPWNKGLKGIHLSKATEFTKGLIPWNKGKEHKAIKGENNCNWTGGKWKWVMTQIKVRDDYTCQICGFREVEIMEVDHIRPKSVYPELRFNFNNLITLCPNCHRRKTNRERKSIVDMKKAVKFGETPIMDNPEPSCESGRCNDLMAAPKGKRKSELYSNIQSLAEMTRPSNN